ncbi:MAG: methyltransferase domain-containing protein [Pirellulales bacterium]|nr:methyltransferase domain-containing protein [Pirellulales bacterium]
MPSLPAPLPKGEGRSPKHVLTESALFLREYIRHFHATGAILPSGRALAAALTQFISNHTDGSPGRTILEVGPGTGSVTRRIVERMGGDDRLDLVELNGTFVELLKRRFSTEPAFRAVAERTRIHHCPIEELPDDQRYELIVSGLPLNNFSVAEVDDVLATLIARLSPGGTLSFFEYIAIRKARAVLSGRSERRRLRGIDAAMKRVFQNHGIRRDAVWLNVPPAWVHHLRR